MFTALILLGLADSIFLTYEHYLFTFIGCPVSTWINCSAVTTSVYSEIFGIPLSVFGAIYYLSLLLFLYKKERIFKHLFLVTSAFGVLFSLYLIYIQAFIINAFCIYCLASALISFLIFILTFKYLKIYWETLLVDSIGYFYKYFVKPILFLFDAEKVHVTIAEIGGTMSKLIPHILKKLFVRRYSDLIQKVLGLEFKTPIGLAAGFDYEANLTQTLPLVGFGFQTIGTITNHPYEGNPKPRLARLPKSQSLLVNKGFKNLGVDKTLEKIGNLSFAYPLGISIGRSNLESLDSIDKSIEDIVKSFTKLKKSKIKNSYYELNISCPNLIHDKGINFYSPSALERLLKAVDKVDMKKPILIKMPIDQGDKHTLELLKVIAKHNIAGVIIGNLQTSKEKLKNPTEADRFEHGKYSGKPTFEDSNRLIKLTYKNFKDRFVIVGCGGVFNAEDAWAKFANGATLVQLITGMIFEGPQLITQINRDLSFMLKERGLKNISQIVGSAV